MEVAKTQAEDFIKFISKGNVIDLSTGIILGSAFSHIVETMVSELFGPLLDTVTTKNMQTSFVILKNGPNAPYKSKADAKADGAVVLGYGAVLQAALNFVTQGLFLYLLLKLLNKAKQIPYKVGG